MAKAYKYEGETFQVEDLAGREVTVSDGMNTLTITLNEGGPSLYRVSTVKGGWWWHTNTPEESINRACRELIEHKKSISPEEAYKVLSDFVDEI